MTETAIESWEVRKPAVSSSSGLVSSQHYLASEAGAEILRRGGNAVDAAIAAGLTLGTVEPWMSGIGGGGYMTIYHAKTDEINVVEFGMRAPFDARADDYPLAGEGTNASDAFNWPKVVGDTNIHGPLSAAVPGYLRGVELARAQFGSMPFEELIEPACRQAEAGLPIDWYSAAKINQWARHLAMYDTTRQTYLADGLPPVADLEGNLKRLPLGNLAKTYRHLQEQGPGAYYSGPLAESIVKDAQAAGSRISMRDLEAYEASIAPPLSQDYRGSTLYVSGNLTAGPSINYALAELEKRLTPSAGAPDADAYKAIADSLFASYEYRLEHLGEGVDTPEIASGQPGNTSHLCVADRDGNVVSFTQTIMSAFGSRIMLPDSGILLNNGMMWFDPRPGGPNSVEGGRRPLCNMCPVILKGADGSLTAIGACGGRKIFPAVFQLAVFLNDYNMTVDEAVHHPRIDVSGTEKLTMMDHIDEAIAASINSAYTETSLRPYGVSPNLFALPQVVRRESSGEMSGGCFVPSPHAKVVAL